MKKLSSAKLISIVKPDELTVLIEFIACQSNMESGIDRSRYTNHFVKRALSLVFLGDGKIIEKYVLQLLKNLQKLIHYSYLSFDKANSICSNQKNHRSSFQSCGSRHGLNLGQDLRASVHSNYLCQTEQISPRSLLNKDYPSKSMSNFLVKTRKFVFR